MSTAIAHSSGTAHLAVRVGLAAVAAAALDGVVALVASRGDDGGIGVGLDAPAYISLSVLGVLVGVAGWKFVERRWPEHLRTVVPAVLVLSWIPDLALFAFGATLANVLGLMSMHVVVAACAVTACLAGRR